jgi:rhomboid family protein
MDYDLFIFWFLCFSCLAGLVAALTRVRSAGSGWVVLFLVILAVAVTGWLLDQGALIYIAAGMWLLFVLLPGLLARVYQRRVLEQRFPAARRLATILSWLHPVDGLRQQPQIIRALELAQRGETAAALATLERFRGVKSLIAQAAILHLYRITSRWEEMILWETQHAQQLEKVPHLLHFFLRARGETGDLRGLLDLYDRRKNQIGKLNPSAIRDLCRLMLFAFCGKRELVERLFTGSLAVVPAPTQHFWIATADLAAGKRDPAKQQFELLLPAADPPMRLAIERRLARISDSPAPPVLSEESVIESAALEHGHDERFAARPTLFSRQALASQVLILLNLSMFIVEILLGGSSNPEALYRLGALVPSAVRAGELWRLAASLFLHFGPLHLAMNMVALWLLGPFVEFALGFRKFLFVYLRPNRRANDCWRFGLYHGSGRRDGSAHAPRLDAREGRLCQKTACLGASGHCHANHL